MTACECDYYDMFHCRDCGMCTNCGEEYYMVTDEVWYSVTTAMDTNGMLCIGCLEARYGKLLTARDFTDAPINDIAQMVGSLRIRARLTDYAPTAPQH